MQLDKQIETALNAQINQEMNAAYNYLASFAWFEEANLEGFAGWMMTQRQEELVHARKLIDYLHDRGGRLKLAAVDRPKAEFAGVKQVFEAALDHERANTESIHKLFALASEKNDYSTQSFLKWFIDEQVEEEKIMHDALGMLEHAGDDRSALLVLNQQFGQRPAEDEDA
jgi:ferritin